MSQVPSEYQQKFLQGGCAGVARSARSAELRSSDIPPLGWVVPQASPPEQKGLKYDQGKPPISLVDPEFIEGVASVLAFGANKYAADNWRGGIGFRRLLDATYRHLGAINKGEDVDGESGLPHIYHTACCIMFLSWMMKHRTDLDDRYKY